MVLESRNAEQHQTDCVYDTAILYQHHQHHNRAVLTLSQPPSALCSAGRLSDRTWSQECVSYNK